MILDKFKLDGKVAIVTRANSGLGQAIALALSLKKLIALMKMAKEGNLVIRACLTAALLCFISQIKAAKILF